MILPHWSLRHRPRVSIDNKHRTTSPPSTCPPGHAATCHPKHAPLPQRSPRRFPGRDADAVFSAACEPVDAPVGRQYHCTAESLPPPRWKKLLLHRMMPPPSVRNPTACPPAVETAQTFFGGIAWIMPIGPPDAVRKGTERRAFVFEGTRVSLGGVQELWRYTPLIVVRCHSSHCHYSHHHHCPQGRQWNPTIPQPPMAKIPHS
mmetsp:Transcript_30224/g.52324  ORF Transcript_30224/g.52324 Transcript_30224/m.52324 type:complete len:204 (-) Transcript_30224:869-1480(-)